MFSTAGWGSRKLSVVPPEDSGYSGRVLKATGRCAKHLFIAPIQEELNTNPLPLNDEAFRSMPKAICQKCGVAVPLPLLTEHIKSCDVIDVDDNLTNVDSGEPEDRKCKSSLFKIFLAYYIAFIEIINKTFSFKISLFLLATSISQQQICRSVLSAQKCLPLILLRYTLQPAGKGILLFFLLMAIVLLCVQV